MYVGESAELDASVYPSNAQDKSISWESSDTDIATVTSYGKLSAIKAGTTYITVKTNRGTTSKYKLTVKNVDAEKIYIEGKKKKVTISDTLELSVIFIPENTTEKDVTWISDNENIATVDKYGNLSAISAGKTKITAIHKELSESFEIEIEPIWAKNISISTVGKKHRRRI